MIVNKLYQNLLSPLLRDTSIRPKRTQFQWLTVVWNRVDRQRIKDVGPEQACAEWLLRNGASIRWKGMTEFISDYNALPTGPGSGRRVIQGVDASDSSIHHLGFAYFSGCNHIEEVKLIRCLYIENEALHRLAMLESSLKYLEILNCGNVTDDGLKSLKNIKNLKVLKLQGMPYVKDKIAVEKELTESLPNCTIEWK